MHYMLCMNLNMAVLDEVVLVRTSYIQKLTGRQLAELTNLSQDRDAWRQLVVEGVYLQPPD